MQNTEPSLATPIWKLLLFWLYVGVPLAWGVWSTVKKALALFN
ncbi:MAG: hypothetical protein ABSB19_00095 [Methylomonas sp.]|jgi:hypothetical protein